MAVQGANPSLTRARCSGRLHVYGVLPELQSRCIVSSIQSTSAKETYGVCAKRNIGIMYNSWNSQ
jgi:hypothetical protein